LFRDFAIPLRLLGIGLPLTILLGAGIAKIIFTDFSVWEAALVAAILAPTDAALGQAVVTSPKVPLKIRQSLNVESGLNDGIVLPIVMLFAAIVSVNSEPADQNGWLQYWVKQVTLGPLMGVIVGVVGGTALKHAKKIGYLNADFEKLSGIALALLAWSGALLIGGNGFIAAFVAGMSISCFADNIGESLRDFGEAEGQLFSLATFLLFGMIIVVPAFQDAHAYCYLYAVLSLTVIRMLPVALSLFGLKLHWPTVLFLGWFGPRGLASLLFALLVVDEFDVLRENQIMTIATITVLMSIVAHGLSAVPGVNWYAACCEKIATPDSVEHQPTVEHRLKFKRRQP
jgi:NhaP-type Na+/H+ or K+/H+ antiporter